MIEHFLIRGSDNHTVKQVFGDKWESEEGNDHVLQ